MARSLKQGCNDHIEELAIIKDKLVTSAVKQKSNKCAKMTPATDKSKKKGQTKEETTDKSKKKGQTKEERENIFNNLLEQEIIQDTIDADKEKKSTGRKKAIEKNNCGGYEKYKKRMEDIRLDATENNRNRMIKLADKKGVINKKKKESDAREAAIDNRIIKIADKIKTAAINKKKKRVMLEKQQQNTRRNKVVRTKKTTHNMKEKQLLAMT